MQESYKEDWDGNLENHNTVEITHETELFSEVSKLNFCSPLNVIAV